MSSVSAYGPDLSTPATEEAPLAAHTYAYGIHKMEADRVVQQRAPALRGCSVYILRPHIFAGASVDNYFMEAFRGIPGGASKRAARNAERKANDCLACCPQATNICRTAFSSCISMMWPGWSHSF